MIRMMPTSSPLCVRFTAAGLPPLPSAHLRMGVVVGGRLGHGSPRWFPLHLNTARKARVPPVVGPAGRAAETEGGPAARHLSTGGTMSWAAWPSATLRCELLPRLPEVLAPVARLAPCLGVPLGETGEAGPQAVQLPLAQVLEIEHAVARPRTGPDQLVELELEDPERTP